MSRLPGDLPGRVESADENYLVDTTKSSIARDDSYASIRSSSNAPTVVGAIALDRLRSLLTQRELEILRSVDRFRYLTALQIEALHFRGHATIETAARIRRRVLERLTAAKLLVKLDRQIGGVRAGSSSFVYQVAPLGYRVVHDHATMSGRVSEPSTTFLDHTLAVAQTAIDLTLAAQRMSDRSVDVLSIETEPSCWRSFQKGLGGRETLKPDLFVALGLGEFEDRWFLEIDLGTESSTAVTKKCRTYLDYQRTGREQASHDVFPKVMWIVRGERRQRLLATAVSKNRDLKAAEIFTIVTSDVAIPTLLEAGS